MRIWLTSLVRLVLPVLALAIVSEAQAQFRVENRTPRRFTVVNNAGPVVAATTGSCVNGQCPVAAPGQGTIQSPIQSPLHMGSREFVTGGFIQGSQCEGGSCSAGSRYQPFQRLRSRR